MNWSPLFSNAVLIVKRFKQRNLSAFWVNLIVFSGIIAIYSFVCSLLLPPSINSLFSSMLWKIIFPFVILFILGFATWKIITRRMAFTLEKRFESFKPADFVLILIPMAPITQYIFSNQETLTLFNSLVIFLLFALLIIVFGIAVPVLLSRVASKMIATTAAISFLSTMMIMAYVSASRGWDRQGVIGFQLLVMLIFIIILSLRKLIPEKIFSLAVIVFFTVNTISGAFLVKTSNEKSTSDTNNNFNVNSVLEGKKTKRNNDILLVIFESYADYETLKHYGYDNCEHLQFLDNNGFRVYHGIYSLGAPTEQSLSKLFNIDRDVYRHKKYLTGGGAVQSLLRKQGYKINCVFHSSWYLRGLPLNQIECDNCFPLPRGIMDSKVLVKAVLMGEFTDTVSFEDVQYKSFLKRKQTALRKNSSYPSMLYSHSCYPGHGPSGLGLDLDDQSKERSGYLDRINNANAEMRQNVGEIIKNNPDAIVIFAGDHGPFMTKTGYGLSRDRGGYKAEDLDRYDIQDRFGMFLAIRWPEKKYALQYKIKIFQDVFPAVLSFLYDDDSLFDTLRLKRVTKDNHRTLGVYVEDGIIHGGKDAGQKLFITDDLEFKYDKK